MSLHCSDYYGGGVYVGCAGISIVFFGSEDTPTPVALLGLNARENLYLKDGHHWMARYIPAFVRRYSFVFSRSLDGTSYTLCIDESFQGCNQEGRGQALFDETGAGTEYLHNMMRFVTAYQQQIMQTNVFCQRLIQLDLLDEMTAAFKLLGGEQIQAKGFMAVDRSKLTQLPADTLVQLVRSGELELIYAHLLSIQNFLELLELRRDRQGRHPSLEQ